VYTEFPAPFANPLRPLRSSFSSRIRRHFTISVSLSFGKKSWNARGAKDRKERKGWNGFFHRFGKTFYEQCIC
jgi:hypothetical protein